MFIRYAGPRDDVIGLRNDLGRHAISVGRADTDDLTVANVLPDSEDPALRPGEVEITEQEFNTELAAINAYNAALPPEPPHATPANPNDELLRAIDAATTVDELKDALRGLYGMSAVTGQLRE